METITASAPLADRRRASTRCPAGRGLHPAARRRGLVVYGRGDIDTQVGKGVETARWTADHDADSFPDSEQEAEAWGELFGATTRLCDHVGDAAWEAEEAGRDPHDAVADDAVPWLADQAVTDTRPTSAPSGSAASSPRLDHVAGRPVTAGHRPGIACLHPRAGQLRRIVGVQVRTDIPS